ncbi:MAG: hypothetical protein JNN28_16875 [Saprospiraceae bacterium]|nr:hypothetical protein [Saprospiraceae bacterium]
MEKTLLGEAFASLSAAELREFGKFVHSPFFNTRASLIDWYDYLSAPEGHEAPETDGVKARLAHSALLALLEKYFIYKEKSGSDTSNKILLAGVYRKRNLPRHFQITLREARQGRTQHNWRHAGYYQNLLDIEWEQYQFDTAQKRTDSLNLQATSDYMDLAFLTQKLRLACLAVSHQAVYKTQYDIGLLEATLIRAESLASEPAIGLYFHCYRFLTLPSEPAEQHFLQFRQMMAQHASSFPKEELRTLFLLAINFGIKKLNESSPGWLRATLDLYRSAIQLDLLLENGQISRFAFTNIVAIAVRAGEADWAESFIHEYRSFLERTWRDATASLNLARVAYARKDYTTALAHLQRSDYKDSINNMVARIYQLKIYYETDEFDLLSSHLANLKNYIRRNTGIGYHRTNYTHIVQYTEQLMALRFNDAKAVDALKEKIRAEKILTEKEWFLDMLG